MVFDDDRDYYHYNEDPEATSFFWDRLNNLRYQIFKVKLAMLECMIDPRAADVLIGALTERIKMARG